jgi:hypothetical protein
LIDQSLPRGREGVVAGAAATWIDTPAAFVIYALTPLFYVTPPAGRGKARHEEPAVER